MLRYSVITPSRGLRPLALGQALDSVLASARAAGVPDNAVEMLVGFDGVQGERVRQHPAIRYFDLPANNDFGNALRQALLKASRGQRLLFLDDDNELTEAAFTVYEAHPDTDMLIARIDVSRAHDIPFLPREDAFATPISAPPPLPIIRPCNIDPLCLCLSRELVLTRCGGWLGEKYEADYQNILRYSRRAQKMTIVQDVVGIYDAGRELDAQGSNFRQRALQRSHQ